MIHFTFQQQEEPKHLYEKREDGLWYMVMPGANYWVRCPYQPSDDTMMKADHSNIGNEQEVQNGTDEIAERVAGPR